MRFANRLKTILREGTALAPAADAAAAPSARGACASSKRLST